MQWYYTHHSVSSFVHCLQALQHMAALQSVCASTKEKIRSTISDGSWDTKSYDSNVAILQ